MDRRALPAPQWSDLEREGSYEAPQTPLEEQVATIWREVLHLERVGIHDNFFALGGHSLLAAQLVSRMQKVFQVEVSLRTLFDDPTVAALTRYLQRAYRPPLPAITAVPHQEHMPTSFAQERLWFLDQLEMGSAFYNVLSAVRLRRQLKVAVLQESLNEMLQRHEILRTSFMEREGRPVQVIAEHNTLVLSLIDLSNVPERVQDAETTTLCGAGCRDAVHFESRAAHPCDAVPSGQHGACAGGESASHYDGWVVTDDFLTRADTTL